MMPSVTGFSPSSRRTSPLWLIIFSDMSTNFMLFFLILFAMTRMPDADRERLIEGMDKAMVNKQAMETRLRTQHAKERALIALNDTIVHGKLRQYARLEESEGKVKLTIEMPFFFDPGSAMINPEAMGALEGLVGPVRDFPHAVVVEGHTDNVPVLRGRYPSNWELSVARAVSVIDFFTERGASPGKFVAGGYGQYRPVHDNDTEEHRALNRRIEITLITTPEARP